MSPRAPRERQQSPRPEPQWPPTTRHRREILRLYLEPSESRLPPEHTDPRKGTGPGGRLLRKDKETSAFWGGMGGGWSGFSCGGGEQWGFAGH